MNRLARFAFCLLFFLAACGSPADPGPASPYPLASFTENRVTVEIALEFDETGQAWLAAAFTPEEGYHLYSKDIPRGGVDGLGRPTLLELVPGSRLEPAGELTESVGAQQEEGPEGLLVYPEGPVTLRLPVNLPEGAGWFDEQVSVTFMACASGVCCPPVAGKLVQVRVPGTEEVETP
ncbi:MAG: hypothetical protein HY781_10350 [Chloroflexi bacterium]|nr:hypothetical protein [Chloroflexota bacterium]